MFFLSNTEHSTNERCNAAVSTQKVPCSYLLTLTGTKNYTRTKFRPCLLWREWTQVLSVHQLLWSLPQKDFIFHQDESSNLAGNSICNCLDVSLQFFHLYLERSWRALCPAVLWATSRFVSPEASRRTSALQCRADTSSTTCCVTTNTSPTSCSNRTVASTSVGKSNGSFPFIPLSRSQLVYVFRRSTEYCTVFMHSR